MSVSNEQLQIAIGQAKALEAQGYFTKAQQGDKRAASLFVRLVAFNINPTGLTSDYGWLTKQPGEIQVDGYAEDAIVFGANPADLQNVVDLIVGAGAPGASIPDEASVKERRPLNRWKAPQALTAAELAYLRGGAVPVPQPPSFPYPDENTTVKAFQERVRKAYSDAGRTFPDPNDSDAFRHFCRYGYSCHEMAEPKAADKHISELRADLGLPA